MALEPEAQRLGVDLGVPRWDDDGWAGKLEVVLDLHPEVVSFACPAPDVLGRLVAAGITTMVAVTTAAEARLVEARGAGAQTVQGPEAGGHRLTLDQTATPAQAPLGDTVEEITAGTDLPVIFTGSGAALIAGVISGGTFLGVVSLGMGTGARMGIPRSGAILTIAFSLGQILGPLAAAPLIHHGYAPVLVLGAIVAALAAVPALDSDQHGTFAAELETRVQALWLEITAGTASTHLSKRA